MTLYFLHGETSMGESKIERKVPNASQEQSPSPWAHSPKDLFGSPLNKQHIIDSKDICDKGAKSNKDDLPHFTINEKDTSATIARHVGKSTGREALHELTIYNLDQTGKDGGKVGPESGALLSKAQDSVQNQNLNGRPAASDVTLASESNTRRGPHGEIIKKLPDGVTTTDYPDGTSVIDTPDTRHTDRPDGTKTVVDKRTGRITTYVPPSVDPKGEGYRVDQMPGKPPEQNPYNWQPPVKPRWRQKVDDINGELEEEFRRRQKHPREEFIRPRGPQNI